MEFQISKVANERDFIKAEFNQLKALVDKGVADKQVQNN